MVLAVVGLLLLGGAGAGAWLYFGGSTPSASQIENRLNTGDARGDGGPYKVKATVDTGFIGEITITLLVHPEKGESVMSLVGTSTHSRGDLLTITEAEETQLFRDYGPDNSVPEEEFTVASRDGRTYRGLADEEPFTLDVDRRGRFETLTLFSADGTEIVASYSYDDIHFPAFKANAARGPTDIAVPDRFAQHPDELQVVQLDDMSEMVKPSELEIHFMDDNGATLVKASFSDVVDDAGYSFTWVDVDGNGLVNSEDTYNVRFTAPATQFRVLDLWAGVYVGDVERLSAPGAGLAFVLFPIVALAALFRRLAPQYSDPARP